MKMSLSSLMVLAGLSMVFAARGADSISDRFHTVMTNPGVEATATGSVDGKLTTTLRADNEVLTVSLAGLLPTTMYQLSITGNSGNSMNAASIITDATGAFHAIYAGGRSVRGGIPLPAVMHPIRSLRELDVINAASQVVLRADLVDPDSLNFRATLAMQNAGFIPVASGSMRIHANPTEVDLQLSAKKLLPLTDYMFLVNGISIMTVTSNRGGSLRLKVVDSTLDVLDIRSLSLTDKEGSHVVLVLFLISDASAPFVTSTNPANGATGVPINRPITATFNKTMNSATINSSTFTVQQGTTAVAGTLTYAGTTATFTPRSNLAAGSTFTVIITTGVTDLAGNKLMSDYSWSFTTGAVAAAGPAPVPLGSANSFVVLAGSTVTNLGPTQLNGDLGVSPGSGVTGFPPGIVTGAIHAGDDAAAQTKNDLLSAYNDAAGRLGAAVLPGNLGGLTFTPGLYKNSTSTMISGTGTNAILTLDAQGDANAVFIFQMGSTLTTDSGTQVVLSGSAKATNVYWQVGTSATLGTTSIFKGNILADQSITLTTGATLEGRALTRIGAVTLDSNSITTPAP